MNQSNAFLQKLLTEIKTAILLVGTGGAGFKVKLAQAPFTPNPNSDPTTFTEADYTGYAAVVLTAMTGNSLTGSSWESTATMVAAFAPTGTTVGNSIGGYWLEDNTGVLLGYDTFNPPIAMQQTSDSINLVVRWQVAPNSWPNSLLP